MWAAQWSLDLRMELPIPRVFEGIYLGALHFKYWRALVILGEKTLHEGKHKRCVNLAKGRA